MLLPCYLLVDWLTDWLPFLSSLTCCQLFFSLRSKRFSKLGMNASASLEGMYFLRRRFFEGMVFSGGSLMLLCIHPTYLYYVCIFLGRYLWISRFDIFFSAKGASHSYRDHPMHYFFYDIFGRNKQVGCLTLFQGSIYLYKRVSKFSNVGRK